MTKLVLKFWTSEGEDQFEFDHDTYELNLAYRGILKIDLSPLEQCTNLEDLVLSGNQIESIDLSPFSVYTKLEVLMIEGTLDSIDFSPLSECMRLEQVVISNNHLKEIDMTPIGHCGSVRV